MIPLRLSTPLINRTLVSIFCALILLFIILSHYLGFRLVHAGRDVSSTTSNTGLSTKPQGCCVEDAADAKPHLLAGSYYTLLDNFSAKLLLNNKGPDAIEVQPTLFSMSGERFDLAGITIEPNSHRFEDFADWVALAGPQFGEGSIQIFHRGKDLVLGTQIYLINERKSLSFDEKLTELGKAGSPRRQGVWWLPSPRGTVNLIVSNTSDTIVSLKATIRGEVPKTQSTSRIDLRPHETKLLNVQRDMLGKDSAMSSFGAISITHEGSPDALLVRAMASDASRGFSLPIQFADPSSAKSTNLQGVGLRIGKAGKESLLAKVVVHNAGDSQTTLNGRVPYTTRNGTTGEVVLPQVQLSSGETELIDVSQAVITHGIVDEIMAGLEFQYSGELGSVITSAFGVSRDGNQVFRVPLWDIAAQRSSTGGYPWYIAGSSSTVVYIKNVTDETREYRMYLKFASGDYVFPLTSVAPRQTTMIDIRKLRDDQIPDVNGQTLPSNESRGQIHWSLTGGQDKVLIGRAEQVDLVRGISSSYACQNCCGNSFYDGWLTPADSFGFEGFETQFIAMQQDANCYGQIYPPYQASSASFISGNDSICSSSWSGLAIGLGIGNTNIWGSWTADGWFKDLFELCEYQPVEAVRDALCEVVPAPHHVKVIVDQQGYPASCPSTGIYVRQIQVQVVDFSGNPVSTNFSVKEAYSNLSSNSCNNGNPIPSSCVPADSGGKFLDTMAVSGNLCNSGISQSSGCGFILDSTWSICSAGMTQAIWTSSRETRSNSVKVNGQAASYSTGTFLFP